MPVSVCIMIHATQHGARAMTTFTGQSGVDTFVAISLKAGIKLYACTGIKPNRMWTATAMLAKATAITGVKFKRGEFFKAVEELEKWIAANGTAGVKDK